jgi:hypothetical protein
MLDSWVHASIESRGVTETSNNNLVSKIVDVLCLHYTLCLMQLSVVRNLIFTGFSDDSPWVDY